MLMLVMLADGPVLAAIEDGRGNFVLGQNPADASLCLFAGLRARDLGDDDHSTLSSCGFPLGTACV